MRSLSSRRTILLGGGPLPPRRRRGPRRGGAARSGGWQLRVDAVQEVALVAPGAAARLEVQADPAPPRHGRPPGEEESYRVGRMGSGEMITPNPFPTPSSQPLAPNPFLPTR